MRSENLQPLVDKALDGCVEALEFVEALSDPVQQHLIVCAVGVTLATSVIEHASTREEALCIAARLTLKFEEECRRAIEEAFSGAH